MPVVDEVYMQSLSRLLHFDPDQHVRSVHLPLPLLRGIIQAAAAHSEGLSGREQREELVYCVRDDECSRLLALHCYGNLPNRFSNLFAASIGQYIPFEYLWAQGRHHQPPRLPRNLGSLWRPLRTSRARKQSAQTVSPRRRAGSSRQGPPRTSLRQTSATEITSANAGCLPLTAAFPLFPSFSLPRWDQNAAQSSSSFSHAAESPSTASPGNLTRVCFAWQKLIGSCSPNFFHASPSVTLKCCSRAAGK